MPVTIDLPAEAQARLEAEAARRGIAPGQLIADLSAAFAVEDDPLEAFIGSGASGRCDLGRRHREIRAEQTDGLSARVL